MRVLITGGNGFIGRYVVERLDRCGHVPIIFDRTRMWRPVEQKQTQMLGDVRDSVAVSESVAQVDGVIHLAGVLGTQETIANPLPAVETNILGSLNVFAACQRYQIPCVYITVGNYWMNNSYSISKATAERFAYMFNREHQTRIVVVRALNAYGPRQKVAPVRKILPTFIKAALLGNPIEIYGDGAQIMDMIHVRDVADILVRALTHGQLLPFEAGTGRRTTVLEIAHLVLAAVGGGTLQHLPMRPGEPPGSVVVGDPETLRPLYAGELPPFIPLEQGIAETVVYYKEQA